MLLKEPLLAWWSTLETTQSWVGLQVLLLDSEVGRHPLPRRSSISFTSSRLSLSSSVSPSSSLHLSWVTIGSMPSSSLLVSLWPMYPRVFWPLSPCVSLLLPRGWLQSSAWSRTWRLWRLLDPHLASAPTRLEHSLKTE